MRNGNILIFPEDIPTLNILLSPWPEDSFNRAQFTCRLSRKQGTTSPSETPAKVLVIKGIHTSITEEQVREELEKQGINIIKLHRITSKATQQPTTFIKIYLTNPNQSAGLLHEGFYMDLFQHRVEKARPPPTIKQCFKCQQFNHISTSCTNPIVCLRCGENHHHKTCPNEKRQAKYANCAGEHSAASKSCPVYLSHMTPSTTRGKPTPTSQPTSNPPSQHQDDTDLTHLRNDLRKLTKDEKKIEDIIKSIRRNTHFNT